ncbi:MAG: PQQ-binding-like beta-propeller repeat protein [bacterium]|nr:PQQ-binding-like beta-propeller repeat protein [bacterium]
MRRGRSLPTIVLSIALASPAAAWITNLGACGSPVAIVAALDGDPIVVCNRRAGIRVARVARCAGTVEWTRRLPGATFAVLPMKDGSPVVVAIEAPKKDSAPYRIALRRIDQSDGRQRWRWRSRRLSPVAYGADRAEYYVRRPGYATPLPDGDVVVVLPSIVVVRVDGATGRERWNREMPGLGAPQAIAATTDGTVVFKQGPGPFGDLRAVSAEDGAVRWTRDRSAISEDIDTLATAPEGDVYAAGTDDLEDSPTHVFVARLAGDGAERWRIRPFPPLTAPSPPIRSSLGPSGTLAIWGTTSGPIGVQTGGALAVLEPSGRRRWRTTVRLDDGASTRLDSVDIRPDGDVVLVADSSYAPRRMLIERLEPTFGFARLRIEQPGRADAVLADRGEQLIAARRTGKALHLVARGPLPPGCP